MIHHMIIYVHLYTIYIYALNLTCLQIYSFVQRSQMRPCLTLSVLNVFAWTGRVSSQLEKRSTVAGLGRKKEKHGANKVICK